MLGHCCFRIDVCGANIGAVCVSWQEGSQTWYFPPLQNRMSLWILPRIVHHPLKHALFFLRHVHNTSKGFPQPPALQSIETSQDSAAARNWISSFKPYKIPRALVELSFSRSSGPGGQVCRSVPCPTKPLILSSHQNVNKVNTKATLRCPIESTWIPSWAKPDLKRTVRPVPTPFFL